MSVVLKSSHTNSDELKLRFSTGSLNADITSPPFNKMVLKAAIIVVSETASQDPSTDKAIPTLSDVFSQSGGGQWEVAQTRIVPDSVLDIQRAIQQWSDGPDALNLIVTSGGTGFAVKDVTPEVSVSYQERRIVLEVPWLTIRKSGCLAVDTPTCSWDSVGTNLILCHS